MDKFWNRFVKAIVISMLLLLVEVMLTGRAMYFFITVIVLMMIGICYSTLEIIKDDKE